MAGSTLVTTNGPDDWNYKLTRDGLRLVLEEIEPRNRKPDEPYTEPDYCGANGHLSGTFFPARGSKPNYGDTILVDHR